LRRGCYYFSSYLKISSVQIRKKESTRRFSYDHRSAEPRTRTKSVTWVAVSCPFVCFVRIEYRELETKSRHCLLCTTEMSDFVVLLRRKDACHRSRGAGAICDGIRGSESRACSPASCRAGRYPSCGAGDGGGIGIHSPAGNAGRFVLRPDLGGGGGGASR